MGLIGKYLDTMPPEHRERVATMEMKPGSWHGGCLVGRAENGTTKSWWFEFRSRQMRGATELVFATRASTRYSHQNRGRLPWTVETRYDALCERLGTARANALIRDRLLTGKRVVQPEAVTR